MKKAVKDLQPGDILPAQHVPGGRPRRVVLYTSMSAKDMVGIVTEALGPRMPSCSPTPRWPIETDTASALVDVEPCATSEDLAQLIEITRAYVAGTPPSITARRQAQDLVDKLSPPNPPTYEELLEALDNVVDKGVGYPAAKDLVERARKVGLLK